MDDEIYGETGYTGYTEDDIDEDFVDREYPTFDVLSDVDIYDEDVPDEDIPLIPYNDDLIVYDEGEDLDVTPVSEDVDADDDDGTNNDDEDESVDEVIDVPMSPDLIPDPDPVIDYEDTGGDPIEDVDGNTISPDDPVESTNIYVWRTIRLSVSDYRPSVLQELARNGAVFYAIYDDGTEQIVTWDQIVEPVYEDVEKLLREGLDIAEANNQHFWDDSNGAHVTDDEQDDWNTEYEKSNHGSLSSPTDQVPWHNLLMNSLGILLRRGLLNLVSVSKSAVSFYDGLGNQDEDITAYFGRTSAQIGRTGAKHIILTAEGITAYNADGTVAPIQAANISAAEANITQLQAATADISTIRANSAKVASLTADALTAATAYIAALNTLNVTANDISADKATISNLTAGNVSVDTLRAASAYISALTSTNVTANDISANKATLNSLIAGTVTADTIRAASAYVAALTSASVTANDISANKATLGALIAGNVTTDTLRAASAYISSLTASNISASTLTADHANVTTIIADYLTSADIQAEQIRVGQLLAGYVETDFSNADVAWIENGTIKDGAITNAMINSVSANKLTAGTIDASNITVTNLNADNITTGTINGQRIGEGSLSLSKLEDDVYTESEVDAMLSTMQAEIDGAIETWTGTAVPTLNNAPASGWTDTATRDRHVGDVYFVVNSQSQQNGYNYRFTKSGSGSSATYSWQLIKDNDVTNALQRLTTAEGKITTFDSDISQLKTDTGSLTTRTTTLETRADGIDSTLLDKVDVTDFNSLEDTVDGHTQTLSQHTTAISNKADSSTVTAVINRVSQNEQNISGITTRVGSLETTIATKADNSTVTTVSNNLSTLSQTVDAFQSTVASTYATKTELGAESSARQDIESMIGTLEDPYTEVEWVESDGKEFIQLDWIPQAGAGFEVDFQIVDTSFPQNYVIFGCRDGSAASQQKTNREFTTWKDAGSQGTLRWAKNDNGYGTYSAKMYTDGRRQQCSLIGNTYTAPDGSTTSIVNGGASPAWGMTIFAGSIMPTRPTTYGGLEYWAKVRIYSLKFYEGSTLAVDLIGAVRKSDGVPGLYDKVSDKFWACRGLSYGPSIRTFGEPKTVYDRLALSNVNLADKRLGNTRLWIADAPMLKSLEDGQQITIRTMWGTANEAKATDLAKYADSGTSSNGYLKLTLAEGTTEWIPLYYGGTTRLTSHYGAGQDVHFTYRENVTSSGASPVPRGWWADANYFSDTNTVPDVFDYAGLKTGSIGVWANCLCMENGNGALEAIATAADGVSTVTVEPTKIVNPHGFKVGGNVFLSSSAYSANSNISGQRALWNSSTLTDARLWFNVTRAAGQLIPYEPLYLVGEISEGTNGDGLFYLDDVWWTQSPSNQSKIYILIGGVYDCNTGNIRAILSQHNPWYIWNGSKLVEFRYSRIKIAETEIIQTNTQIALKANSADVYTKTQSDGLISTEVTNRNAAISAATQAIELSVSETYATKTEFNALEIGGRNLARSTYSVYDANAYLVYNRIPVSKTLAEIGEGSTLTIQLWGVELDSGSTGIRVYWGGGSLTLFGSIIPDENGYACKTVKISHENATHAHAVQKYLNIYNFANGHSGASLKIDHWKLEKGTKPTDWTPAPEDMASQTDLTAAKAAIKVTTDGITSEVEKKTDKTSIISTINQSAESVKIQASKVDITGDVVFSAINNDTGTTKISGGKIDATSITIGQSQVTGLTEDISDAKKTATNYISLDSTGIRIANANPATATTYQHQTFNKTEFVSNNTSVAEFGATTRIGRASHGNVLLSEDGFDYNQGDTSIFSVSPSGTEAYDIAESYSSVVTIAANDTGQISGQYYRNSVLETPEPYYQIGSSSWLKVGETSDDPVRVMGLVSSVSMDGLVSFTFDVYNGLSQAINVQVANVYDVRAANVRIGKTNESHMQLDYHSIRMIDKEGSSYFHVSDLRDTNGLAEVSDFFIGNGTTTKFTLNFLAYDTNYSVTLNGTEVASSGITKSRIEVEFTSAPATDAEIVITYTTESAVAKAYTLGIRAEDTTIGPMSFAEGYNVEASGAYSHAEGYSTKAKGLVGCHAEGRSTTASGYYGAHAEGEATYATGSFSHAEGHSTRATSTATHAEGTNSVASATEAHAEGYHTTASGYEGSHAEGKETTASGYRGSHAEGDHTTASGNYGSHAEGEYTIASGRGAHAEGNNSRAVGNYSHAQNTWTIAGSDNQTVIGVYNSNDSNNAFEIGNGNATTRSNALTVDWSGNVDISGGLASNGAIVSSDTLQAHDGREIFGGTSDSLLLQHKDANDAEDFRIQFYIDSNGHPALRGSLNGGTSWEYPYPNQYASHTANTVWAAPNGSNGSAGFRALVAADIPNLNASKITAGSLDIPGSVTSDGAITSGAAIYAHDGQEIFGGTDALIRIYHKANNSEDFRFDFYIDSNGNPAMRASLDSGSSWKYPYLNQLSSRTANTVLAGPNGSNGAPSFRALVAADIPNLNASKITGGTLGTARGGTGVSGRQSSTITVDTSNVTVGDTNHCWHNGVVCSFSYNFKTKASLANNGTLAVGTLPSGYRPPYAFVGSAYTSTASAQVDVTISTAGVITVRNVSGAAIATSVTIRVGGTFAL